MNTSVSKRPGPMCRLVQGWVSVFGDGAPPQRGFGSRHVAACECCRRFFHEGAALDSALRRDAVRETETASSDLERRILESLQRPARPQSSRRRLPLGALSLVGAAAVAVMAFFISQKPVAPVNQQRVAMVNPTKAGNQAGAPLTAGGLWNGLQPAAGAILNGEPLQHEADAVYSNARSAIGFLALNFLPSVPASLNPEAGQISPRSRATSG